jgi:hypothetical protein
MGDHDMTSETTETQRLAWGAQAAKHLTKRYQNLTKALEAGLAYDPAEFIAATSTPQTDLGKSIVSVLDCIEREFDAYVCWSKDKIKQLDQEKSTFSEALAKLAVKESHKEHAAPAGAIRRKTKDPEKFTGKEKDVAKRQEAYEEFRSHCHRMFAMDRNYWTDDWDRIEHLANLLGGDAFSNNQWAFDAICEAGNDPEKWPTGWHSLEAVWIILDSQYITQDLARRALLKYDNCAQRKRPFGDFIAEFKSLASKCEKTGSQMVSDLRLKVSSEINEVAKHRPGKPKSPDAILEWIAWYQEIYDELEDAVHYDKMRETKGSNFRLERPESSRINHRNLQTTTALTPAPKPEATGDPMDLDVAKHSRYPQPSLGQGRNRISPGDIMKFNLCRYCKEEGHYIRDCPARAANDAKWGRFQNNQGGGYQNSNSRQLERFNQYGRPPSPMSRSNSPSIHEIQNQGRGRYNDGYGKGYSNNHSLRAVGTGPDLGGYVESGSGAGSDTCHTEENDSGKA